MNLGGGKETVRVPQTISAFVNDAGYISGEQTEELLKGYTKAEDVETIVGEAVSQIPAGENGLSAYEIAVIDGFTGTVEEWINSLNGADGFSPVIEENADNSETVYRLDITTVDGKIVTPNLRGKDGGGSGSGGIFGFEIREDGHLWMITDDPALADKFYINNAGHFIYRLE